MKPEDKEIIARVMQSIAEHPEQWKGDGAFEIENITSGIKVWLACDRWGLAIEIWTSVNGNLHRYTVGGVTLRSTFFGWATPWRRALYRAAYPLLNKVSERTIARLALNVVRAT